MPPFSWVRLFYYFPKYRFSRSRKVHLWECYFAAFFACI